MPRNGRVHTVSQTQGMVAIATNDDGFTIIELLSEWEIDVDDVMTWANDYGLGSEIYKNQTKGTSEEVYVQDHSVAQLLF